MALIKCYECSKEISDKAKSCPHCGASKPIECYECKKLISKTLRACPNCGVERPSIFTNIISKTNKKKKINKKVKKEGVGLFENIIKLIELIIHHTFKFLGNRQSLISQISNKKQFVDLKTNRFESLVFFMLLWGILHLIMIATGCFEGNAYYNTFYNEFQKPEYSTPETWTESFTILLIIFLPYWIIKVLTSIIMSLKEKSFIWPSNIMLKFIPIALMIVFKISFVPMFQKMAQEEKQSKKIRAEEIKRNYDWN